MSLPSLFYFTDDQRGADPRLIAAKLPAGSAIVFRHYYSDNRAELASILSKICKKRNIILIIAQDPDLASRVGAAGCHIPQHLISNIPRLKARFPHLFFTAACHTPLSLQTAVQNGTDAVFLSPIFATKSHVEVKNIGSIRAALMKRGLSCPVFALGGVTQQNFKQLTSMGFSGYGAISSLEDQVFKNHR